MTKPKDHEGRVISGLTELIRASLRVKDNARWNPGMNPDNDDAVIKHHEVRAARLRVIREELENVFSESNVAGGF